MSQELERVYTINLGKVKISQSQHRAVRAINMIREFARHHMKVETIKIEEELAHEIWARGVRNPPRKIRVRMSKTDDGYILVSKYDEDVESVTTEKETPSVEDAVKEEVEAKEKAAEDVVKEGTVEAKEKAAEDVVKEGTVEAKEKAAEDVVKEGTVEAKEKAAEDVVKEGTVEEAVKESSKDTSNKDSPK